MQTQTIAGTDLDLVLLREVAHNAGLSERSMKVRLEKKGIRVIAVSPKRLAVRRKDYAGYLEACQL